MDVSILVLVLLVASSIFYYVAKHRSIGIANKRGGIRVLHSAPQYYGIVAALLFALPSLLVLGVWLYLEQGILMGMVLSEFYPSYNNLSAVDQSLLESQILILSQTTQAVTLQSGSEVAAQAAQRFSELVAFNDSLRASGVLALGACTGFAFLLTITPKLRARNVAEWLIRMLLFASSLIAIFTTIGIVLSVLFESIRFFQRIPFFDFLLGLHWSPQIAIRADQVGSTGHFGAIPLFTGTLLIAGVAMAVAVPVGLMSAIYLSEYSSKKIRSVSKPVLEILAGVPTVVYGFFAVLVVAPSIHDFGESIGMDIAHESALAAGLVMGVMIIPFVSSLSDDVISAVPQSLREASLAVGATRSETIKKVIIPAALPGIIGALLLAISRAIGETMIVLMAAGLAAKLTANPLESVTTVTVQIVTLLVGDQEFDSPKTLAAFALGLTLFAVTLLLNVTALYIVRKYSERYE